MTVGSFFSIMVNGQIESGWFPSDEDLYCKYSIVHGSEWEFVSGLEEGISQTSKKGLDNSSFVWNFPVEIGFRSTNAFGWPQIVLSVYGLDSFGRDVVKGYGAVHLPVTPGKHEIFVPTFTPVATSNFNHFLSWLLGRLPEYVDPRFISKSDGRGVTRVSSYGSVKLSLQVISKDFDKCYQYSAIAPPSTTILPPPSSFK